MRALLAAMRCEKGAVEANLASHRAALERASAAGCDLAVFPELSLTGSVDPHRQPEAPLEVEDDRVGELVAATVVLGVGAVFGLAERGGGGRTHISQAFARDGRLVGVYRKRHLGEDEDGFTPGCEPCRFPAEAGFGVAICAEGRVDYPFAEPAAAGAEVVFFCAAPGLEGRRTDEAGWSDGLAWWESCGLAQARGHAERERIWVALVTQAGATADEDFPGLAALVDPAGRVVSRLPDWRPGDLVVDIP